MNQLVKEFELPSENSKVQLIDFSKQSSKVSLFSSNLNAKNRKLDFELNSTIKILITDGETVTSTTLQSHSPDSSKHLSVNPILPQTEFSLDSSSAQPLIDRKKFKSTEEFEIYESIIQGKNYYTPALLCDSSASGPFTIEHSFDRPISLFSLGVELYFSASTGRVRSILDSGKKETQNKEGDNTGALIAEEKTEETKEDAQIEEVEMMGDRK